MSEISRQVRRQQERGRTVQPSTPFVFSTWKWQRASPRRKPGQQTGTVVFKPYGHLSMPRKTNPDRAKRRLEAKIALAEGHLRDQEVGINPIHLGGRGFRHVYRGSEAHKAWQKRLKAWQSKRAKVLEKETA